MVVPRLHSDEVEHNGRRDTRQPSTSSGWNPVSGRRATIRDIAAAAQVSAASVSYALNDKPGIAEQTRQRILKIAQDLDWEPDASARNLAVGGSVHACGLIWTREASTLEEESFPARYLSSLADGFRESGVSLLFAVEPDFEAELELYRSWARRRQVDAVILLNLRPEDARIELLESLRIRPVLAGHPGSVSGRAYCWADDAADMTTIVRSFAERGVQRFGHIDSMRGLVFGRRRSSAFRKALREGGLQEAGSVSVSSPDQDQISELTLAAMAAKQRPELLLLDSDIQAVWAQRALLAAGVEVGVDVGVVAFDDSLICAAAGPTITALDRHPAELGRLTTELLLDPDRRRPLKVSPGTLVQRQSTARWA